MGKVCTSVLEKISADPGTEQMQLGRVDPSKSGGPGHSVNKLVSECGDNFGGT